MLAVVIPTVDGREAHLERCVNAYTETLAGVDHCTIVINARIDDGVLSRLRTCGEVWNVGVAQAKAGGWADRLEYVHLSADDLEPFHGWYDAAVARVAKNQCPVPHVWTAATGRPESGGAWQQHLPEDTPVAMSVIPFLRIEWWEDIAPIHYYSDNYVSSVQLAAGRQQVVTPGYAFRHHWADTGRRDLYVGQGLEEQAIWAAFHQSLGLA